MDPSATVNGATVNADMWKPTQGLEPTEILAERERLLGKLNQEGKLADDERERLGVFEKKVRDNIAQGNLPDNVKIGPICA